MQPRRTQSGVRMTVAVKSDSFDSRQCSGETQSRIGLLYRETNSVSGFDTDVSLRICRS